MIGRSTTASSDAAVQLMVDGLADPARDRSVVVAGPPTDLLEGLRWETDRDKLG
jgi:hypothetical protein